MEHSHQTDEVSAGQKELRKSKRRKPETIGFLAVKPESVELDSTKRPPEVSWLHSIQQAPEHIGHMLMAANEPEPKVRVDKPITETTKSAKIEVKKSVEQLSQPITDRRVDTISRAELLSLSQTIIIDGSSLRQIYETHLIGERGLRRLVAEHLRGGGLKEALRREVIEREIDFERDPIMRDMAPYKLTDKVSSSGGKAALNELLQRATTSINDSSEESAFFKARAAYEANHLQQHKKHRRVMDITLAGSIVVLVALLIVLYLSRN
jgi:hypothetical protein